MNRVYSITDAKRRFGELIASVEHGDDVTLTRRGRPVARIVAIAKHEAKPKMDVDALRAFRAGMPKSPIDAATMIRAMRDEEPGW